MKLSGAIGTGEIWRISGRKGVLVVRVLKAIKNIADDDFFEAEIIAGKARYLSISNNLEQKVSGMGTVGHKESFRTTLTTFMERVPEDPAEISFKDAMKQAKAGHRVREVRMGKGWTIGWFAKAKGFFCINPVTGSNYLYRPTDEDKASKRWKVADA